MISLLLLDRDATNPTTSFLRRKTEIVLTLCTWINHFKLQEELPDRLEVRDSHLICARCMKPSKKLALYGQSQSYYKTEGV